MALALIVSAPVQAIRAAESDPAAEARIGELAPKLEAYIADGMKAFGNPSVAIGIVAGVLERPFEWTPPPADCGQCRPSARTSGECGDMS